MRVQEVQDHVKGSSESPYPENDSGMILGDFFPMEFNLFIGFSSSFALTKLLNLP